jgi:phosphoadenosine phosphosulfate reductase
VITGRRVSQGANRANLKPLEVDTTGLLKLNPLFAWTFTDVRLYIENHNVPHNDLLNQGYKSVGDWHSTQKSVEEEGDSGERAGRWAGREEKTECGLHEDYFKMKHLVGSSSFVLALSMANLISIFRRNRRRKTQLQL